MSYVRGTEGMTYLWSGMILIGIIYGALTGNFKAVTEAAVSSGKDAVTLCISMDVVGTDEDCTGIRDGGEAFRENASGNKVFVSEAASGIGCL